MDEIQQEIVDRVFINSKKNILLYNDAKIVVWESIVPKYSYNFSWQGRPIIQYPKNMVAMQELIWSIKPDLII